MTKVAMISGATRGIGLAVAKALRAEGYALSLGVRRPDATATLFADAGPDVFVHPYEAGARTSGRDWTAATLGRFGRIDVVVANAGIAPFVGLAEEAAGDDAADDALDHLLDINVKAPFRLIRAALPALKRSGSGRVIVVASLSGKRVLGLNAGYQMTKHAMVALTHAVRRIGWDDGIRATAVCPGYVATDLVAGVTEIPAEAMTSPDDLARLVATVVQLPNTASVAELLVNCRYETTL